jgi:hypothetical protein
MARGTMQEIVIVGFRHQKNPLETDIRIGAPDFRRRNGMLVPDASLDLLYRRTACTSSTSVFHDHPVNTST